VGKHGPAAWADGSSAFAAAADELRSIVRLFLATQQAQH
jgi:hypothetical protein